MNIRNLKLQVAMSPKHDAQRLSNHAAVLRTMIDQFPVSKTVERTLLKAIIKCERRGCDSYIESQVNDKTSLVQVVVLHLCDQAPIRDSQDRKSTRLNSSHSRASRMPSSA